MNTFEKRVLLVLVVLALIGAVFVFVGDKVNENDAYVSCDQSTCADMNVHTNVSPQSERTIIYSCDKGNLTEVRFMSSDDHLIPANLPEYQKCVSSGVNVSCDLVISNRDTTMHTITTEQMQCGSNPETTASETAPLGSHPCNEARKLQGIEDCDPGPLYAESPGGIPAEIR